MESDAPKLRTHLDKTKLLVPSSESVADHFSSVESDKVSDAD